MKNYVQKIKTFNKKENTVTTKRVYHDKPLTAFQQKLVNFRRFVIRQGSDNVNDPKLSISARTDLRKRALSHAKL
tara:strand:+ start:26066 stop:26290 length:225 start_codon:yes stop_codon:yes gene_type:complete